ncbi:TetR/AcrR family transcriptional regulator [Agromyces mediolanus]|uniref:TetR/AcrR family transcriptional regulator n=1 Tax=Agromyces mediolanus TaxID=41986 RepID=UPI003834DB58
MPHAQQPAEPQLPAKAPKPSRSGATRAAILGAATELLSEHGVRGVTVEAVAEAADVSLGLLYYHFENRQDLIRAALAEALQNYAYRRPPQDLPPAERLRTALSQHIGVEAEAARQDRVYAEAMRAAAFDPAIRPALTETLTGWNGGMTRLVAAAVPQLAAPDSAAQSAEQAPTAPAAEAATALTALVDGLQQRVRSSLLPPERALELLGIATGAVLESGAPDAG